MTTTVWATVEQRRGAEVDATDDISLLVRLSSVRVELHRYRQEAATATTRLRERRSQVRQRRALLDADSLALAAVRDVGVPDRVAADILSEAVAGGQRDYESAFRRASGSVGALRPFLTHLSSAITRLEREAANIRAALTPFAVRALDVLERKGTLPLVAHLHDGACGECHLCVPTALASAVGTSVGVQRCPHCKRVLVARGQTRSRP